MMTADRIIDQPTFQYVGHETMVKELEECMRRQSEKMSSRAIHIRYRTKNQVQEEKEELVIAGEIDAAKNLHDLEILLREGRMKEFYEVANKIMRIKRSNPVVTKVKRDTDNGDTEIFEEHGPVEAVIAGYFTKIYKRPSHMAIADENANEDIDMGEEQINTNTLFNRDDVANAAMCSNFNKGLGPDCFDGNTLKKNSDLNNKMMMEITDALNSANLPEYLRVGRLVPLQKTATKGPVALDDIRPIVVRSHISKIMEKAILEKINETCPHVIASKIYQTGFKEGKSTAIHASRLFHEVHGRKKRRFNLLVDLQKAYDSVDRQILWRLLKQRCKSQ